MLIKKECMLQHPPLTRTPPLPITTILFYLCFNKSHLIAISLRPIVMRYKKKLIPNIIDQVYPVKP